MVESMMSKQLSKVLLGLCLADARILIWLPIEGERTYGYGMGLLSVFIGYQRKHGIFFLSHRETTVLLSNVNLENNLIDQEKWELRDLEIIQEKIRIFL
ncbi:hypothetical protein Tco_0725931 [Tanacetum coccineum]|uniref:Uncharacterized protein n=1 Tax=Tanacetum coccineum TaxID=301880 RepID=A0ABQ4YEA5_9ASTR